MDRHKVVTHPESSDDDRCSTAANITILVTASNRRASPLKVRPQGGQVGSVAPLAFSG